MFKPEIYAKGSLSDRQLNVKEMIGCDGLEVQLLGELIENRELGIYKSAEEVFDLDDLMKHDVKVVHAPLVPGMGDVVLEVLVDNKDQYLLEQIFYIANRFGEHYNRSTLVVMHSESFYEALSDLGDAWFRLSNVVGKLLIKYPNTELVLENVSPLRGIGKNKEIHLSNNFAFDNVVMAKKLREELDTDRVGVCLDTCHQMLSEKYIIGFYNMLGDVEVPDLSLYKYLDTYKDYIKLIHLCDMKGSGYGKGRHGIRFTEETYDKLTGILDAYRFYNCTCPITLEVEETNFDISDGYAITKELVDRYFGA